MNAPIGTSTMNGFKRIVFFSAFCLASALYAHTGASGIVKERMDAMQTMSDKTKLVSAMFKGKRNFDYVAVVDAADAYVTHGSTMAKLFPDTPHSRSGSETEALPRIWDEWDEFNDQVNEFIKISEAFKDRASQTQDVKDLRKAFFSAAKQCSACHKKFREPRR